MQQQHSYLRPTARANFLSIVDDEQLDHLRANPRISLVAYSPILKGIYDDPAKRDGHPSMADYADADARLARLTALAGELDVTPNQLVLAWLLHQTDPTPITPVGPRTPEQLDTALDALHVKLSAEHLALLDG